MQGLRLNVPSGNADACSRTRVGGPTWNRVVGILFFATLLLALYPPSALPEPAVEPSHSPVVQFGLPQRRTNPVSIPPGARPPDRLLRGATAFVTITALAFSPDGQWLAWGGYDQTITIWNAATGAEQGILTWPRSQHAPLRTLEFSRDGTRLGALTSGELRIWDVQTGRKVYALRERGLFSFTYSPDGTVWAASIVDGEGDAVARVEIRDAATGHILRTIPTKWYGVTGMTITGDGLLVASGTTNEDIGDEHDPKGTVQVWDLASGKLLRTSAEFAVVGPLSPDGRCMAAIDPSERRNTKVIITDLSNGQVKWTFQMTDAATLWFSPDSQALAVTSGGSERGLSVWSLVTGAAISSVHGERDPNDPSGLTTVAFSSDGTRMAAAPYPVSSAKLWDVAAGRELREFAAQFSVQALAMSPDGKWLVAAAPGVTVRDPATGKITKTLTLEDADMLLFSPDGRWLAANPGVFPGGTGRSLDVWDTRTWTLAATITPPRDPRLNLPVQWLAFGGNPSAHRELGNAHALQFTAEGQTHTVWVSVYPLAVSPDGSVLAELGYPLNNVDVWDTRSGQKLQTFSAHGMGTAYLAFSRDGRSLVSIGMESLRMPVDLRTYRGTTEFRVKLWDVATWKERMSVSVPLRRPASAMVSPDGHRLAIERSRDVVDVVDADTGRSLGVFAPAAPARDPVWMFGKPNLAFSPDGSLLFQGAKDGIRVWELVYP